MNFWVFKKPGTRQVLKRVSKYPFQQLLCGCKYCYTVPRRVGITVLMEKSPYCNAKCCLL